MLQCCSVAVLQCCSVAVLRCCGVAVLQCCSVAVLQCCSAAVQVELRKTCGHTKFAWSSEIAQRHLPARHCHHLQLVFVVFHTGAGPWCMLQICSATSAIVLMSPSLYLNELICFSVMFILR